ncbi:hypothetical protein GCM10027436_56510 [Actinophytocola sediminis]
MRDMIGAMVVLLVIVGVLVTVTRGCSFDPGGPSVAPDSAPSVDASAKLRVAAGSVAFPVRQPELSARWRANSSSTSSIGEGADADVVVRVGWVTPSGRYLQLSQSGGDAQAVLAAETGESAAASRSVEVAGVTWDEHASRREEVAWLTTFDGTVTVVTGSATEEEFRTMAEAVGSAKPLP